MGGGATPPAMSKTSFPDDENGAALSHMAEHGVDLSAAHELDFEHVFPDEPSARRFVKEARELVRDSSVHGPEDAEDDEWEVQCRVRLVPTHEAIGELEAKLERVAEACGGYSDGWGLQSNPDGSPMK